MVSPEAALGGPVALVEKGDRIRIDLPERRIDLVVAETELRKRLAAWKPPRPRYTTGYLSRYVREVSTLDQGAVLRSY
jgi:dihydroxy-acid dehydratase